VQFVFSDHTLDIDRRELLRGGTPIAVESKAVPSIGFKKKGNIRGFEWVMPANMVKRTNAAYATIHP
jgi:hypothetical protein